MTRKYTLPVLTALAAAAALAGCGSAATPPSHASLVIRHQTRGCHTWSVNGGRFAATQTVDLRRGGWIMVTNNDVMPQKLVKTSGPAAQMLRPLMNDMGAKTRVVFGRKGLFRFTTKAGEDYMPGMKTVGEDYLLRLTVRVS